LKEQWYARQTETGGVSRQSAVSINKVVMQELIRGPMSAEGVEAIFQQLKKSRAGTRAQRGTDASPGLPERRCSILIEWRSEYRPITFIRLERGASGAIVTIAINPIMLRQLKEAM
jgi:hypothetical protein